MKQVLVRKGQVRVEDVPSPVVKQGTVLISVIFSCISAGTELRDIRSGSQPLWKKALEKPAGARKAIKTALTEGIRRASHQVQTRFSFEKPIGYSLAGSVLEVGEGICDLRPGDAVACAGAQYAHHAEIVCVPRNLTVPIPKNLGFAEASTVALGAIALQGVRRLNPTLGECFVVIGLGNLGQLAVQLLKANGCKVIGTDLDEDRIARACSLGMDMGLYAKSGNHVDQVHRLTGGLGADGVIVAAHSFSNELLSTAFKMSRKKGRVVLVGAVGMNLNRADIYSKELDFFISTSYGPGRYDERYEEHGFDYPASYVRWTENRNMAEYLRLAAEGRINVKKLISATYPLLDAPRAYADLQKSGKKPLITLLSYPQPHKEVLRQVKITPSVTKPIDGKIRIAVVGAGNFAKRHHLPNLQKLSGLYEIRSVCDLMGHNAKSTARQFKASYASTDYSHILEDPDIDAVIIATRHNLHAEMTLQALRAGKHVLVEKPLALSRIELDLFRAFYAENANGPVLLTGFNRRFSPHIQHIKQIVDGRSNPMIINYRMNAGYIPLDHWVHGPEGGGRNIGECCHIYDLFSFLTESKIKDVTAKSIRPHTDFYSPSDNFVGVMLFEDGTTATLTYVSLGSKEYSKEKMEIFVDGKVLTMEDYKTSESFGLKDKGMKTRFMEKGHLEELKAFARALSGEMPWPNPLWQQIQAMEIAFQVEKALGLDHRI